MAGNKLGIFVRVPAVGTVKTRLWSALSPEAACDLYRAFLGDLFERLQHVKAAVTVFYGGDAPGELSSMLPRPWPLVAQSEGDLGVRMSAALRHLLSGPASRAVLIGSDSPDLPLPYLKRAFQRLKHSDVVIGPAMDGGYYLIGTRSAVPAIFEGVEWGSNRVLAQTIDAVAQQDLNASLLPPWYDVDDPQSLELLRALCAARRISGGVRLRRIEAWLSSFNEDPSGP